MIWIGIVVIIFLGELLVKNWVEVKQKKEKKICNKVIVTKTHNYGAALNLGEESPEKILLLSSLITVGVGIIFLFFIGRRKNRCKCLGISLILGGGLSNTYDRWKRGYVVDYIKFITKWKKCNKIAFNISDFAIMIGSLLLLIGERKKVNM